MISERNKYILTAIAIVSLAVLAGNYINNSPALNLLTQTSSKPPAELPDTYVNQANITTYGVNGNPKYRIKSTQFIHFPGYKDAEVLNPLIFVFQEQGSPWKIRAQKGWVTPDGEQLRLQENVVISRQASKFNQFSQLESEHLSVWPKQEYAESDKAVKITTDETIVTAVGLEADLYQQQYHLLSQVKVKLLKGQRE